MEDFGPTSFSTIILYKEVDVKLVMSEPVTLEIDASYTIGKSIAVLHGGNVIEHLAEHEAPLVWRFPQSE